MSPPPLLLLERAQREALWKQLAGLVESYTEQVGAHPVTPQLDPAAIRALLQPFDFATPRDPAELVEFLAAGLQRLQVHTPHPRYYGLYNPAPTTMGIAADTLVAAFNPQLAAWSHSPLAVEIEQHLVRALGGRFGFDPAATDGTFCSGGAEANHTAVLCALTHAFPEFALQGLRALAGQPVFYASAECHHSFMKAARMCGLGQDALRLVPADNTTLRMSSAALEEQIAQDRAAGYLPFLAVATAGTTNAGVVDPIPEIAAVAQRQGLWFHADAAWGGAAALSRTLRPLLAGIGLADSITFDAHKWLSVPMGAGLFLTRHQTILHRAFGTVSAYMPKEAAGLGVTDPHLHSMQWSRRFTGAKVFLSLAAAGWSGYEQAVDHMTAMGALLREELSAHRWHVLNPTPLPVVCFVDASDAPADPDQVARAIVAGGEAWLSTTVLASARKTLRACITNYRTQPTDIHALVTTLDKTRECLRLSA